MRASCPTGRIRAWARILLAWCAVWVVATGPVAAMAHYVWVPHGVCEHGQLVHLDEHGSSSEHTAGASRAVALDDTKSSERENGHEHCDILGLAERSDSLAESPAVSVLLEEPTESTPIVGRSKELNPQPILAFSPKTSPPASARL